MKKGQKHSLESRQKMSRYLTLNPRRYWLGRKRPNLHSEETKKIIGLASTGRTRTEEFKKSMRERMRGQNNPMWKGGIDKDKAHVSDRKNHNEKIRRYRKKGAGGSFTNKEWQDLKNKHGNRCVCCNKDEKIVKLTADHINPVSLGGNSDILNIQPLCVECNSRKGTKKFDYRMGTRKPVEYPIQVNKKLTLNL